MTTNPAARALTQRLGVALPIIQAPMAGVSSAAMAAAVTNAGGLGSIGIGVLGVAAAGALIADLRTRTAGPFNVNVFCHRPAEHQVAKEIAWVERLRPEFLRFDAVPSTRLASPFESFSDNEPLMRLLVDARPAVVSFHFGLPPAPVVEALHAAGSLLLATATSLDEARRVARSGVDVIVAQGWEAGGHRGVFDPDAPDECLGTMALTRLLVHALNLPVVAAGGLMDGAGIGAVLKLGASAAQLGTAFLAADESLASPAHRARLFSVPTIMTRAISGRPARALTNRLTDLGEHVPSSTIPEFPLAFDIARALDVAARARGDTSFGAHWAGQGATLARALPAAEIVATLAREMDSA